MTFCWNDRVSFQEAAAVDRRWGNIGSKRVTHTHTRWRLNQASGLLLKHVNCILVFHFQLMKKKIFRLMSRLRDTKKNSQFSIESTCFVSSFALRHHKSCSSGFIIKTSFGDIMAGLNSLTEKLAETWLCLNFRVLFAWQPTHLTKPGFYFGK